jgi:TPR repeat protein
MIGGIFYWQDYLDGMPIASAPSAVVAPQAFQTREWSAAEMIEAAADLRQAGMPMLAAHFLMPLAEEGNVTAMRELALSFLASGELGEEAVFLLRGAAEGGSREALAELVQAVENPLNMGRYNAASFQHLEFAAKLGEASAWMPLGERFEQGHGAEKSLDLALAAYEKARAAGERRATAKLAARQEALECVAGFVRSWNEVSVATLLDHVSVRPKRYFTQEKPAMEALLRTEEQMRALWPLRRISVSDGANTKLASFERIEVAQPFQFELQRGERIARGTGMLTCEVEREEGGWRVVRACDEVEIKELLPSGGHFVSAESLRELKPAFTKAEQVEETRLEILEKMRGLDETQDFKPLLTLLLNTAMTFPQEEFWRPFADKLCDRMAREFFAQGHWLDAAWSAPVHQLAELGSVSAMLLEGHLLMAGYGYSRDEKRGLVLYAKAFEAGKRRDARFYYAEALFQGRGTVEDFEKACALALSFMARSKHPLEAYLAAHLLWRKAEADPSLWQDVYDTLSRVAEKHPPAKHLAAIVLLNHGNTTRERKTGFTALKAAAEAGVPEAMKNLSKCYQDGTGCEKDFHQATLWKQKALVTEAPKRRHYSEFGE